MITEKAKEQADKKKIENGIRLFEESITKAEKYERLKDNKDWQGFLDDLKTLMTLHDNEIRMGQMAMMDAPNFGYVKTDDFGKQIYVNSKLDWTDFIIRHEIQKDEASNWIKEPESILAMAALAREKLPMLKEKLKELESAASENGRS